MPASSSAWPPWRVTAVALWLCPADGRRKMRTLQVIAILPTAALPLATGGDDMPIVAFLLLAMVLAQRRQPFAAGVVLGVVSAMKFTAWPLAAAGPLRRPGPPWGAASRLMFLGMLVIAGPVVVPFALRGPWAFFDNVVLFPLGLSGVTSPAASPLPGHLLVTAFPFLHRALPLVVGLVGGALLAWHLSRRTPQTAAEVCTLGRDRDGGDHPAGPGHPDRLPALPDQLLRVVVSPSRASSDPPRRYRTAGTSARAVPVLSFSGSAVRLGVSPGREPGRAGR